MKIRLFGFLLASTLMSACGGSDSVDSTSGKPSLPPATPAPSTGELTPLLDLNSVQIFGTSQTNAGSATGYALIPKGSAKVDSIIWRQTSGPSLEFLAANSQTIGFDVPESGNYSLSVDVKMEGESLSSSYTVDFSASNEQQLAAVRLDHTASELSKVSLHIGIPSDKTIQNIRWEQLGGPQAQNVEEQDEFLFFDAPSVSTDAVLSYRATVDYTDGTTASDDVLLTIKNTTLDTNGLFYRSGSVISEDIHAYKENSPFKTALERCIYNNDIPGLPDCTLRDLPLIGMDTSSPNINDVLNRTLVSHQWMGDRFAEFLQTSAAGPDMLKLLRGVTAVVISYDVRPSFYWVATGAIYLDANNFWQTPSERDTLNDQPDYRTDFGSELQFSVYWRYTKDNDYYPKARIDKQDRVNRDFYDLEGSISWLMYHELAHANDYFEPSAWSSISPNITPYAYYQDSDPSSDVLNATFPLRSSEMHALAQVRFDNAASTSTQRNYRGSDIVTFFTPDISPSFYSYLTQQEDFATLVERYMMLFRLDAEADIAIIDGRTSNDEALVVWGQRNRISENSIEDRTVYALSKVYPELGSIRETLRSLPAPILMRANEGWFENLGISPSDTNPFGNRNLDRIISPKFDLRDRLSSDQLKALENEDSTRNHHKKVLTLP
jgi:hypothetical protein